MLTMTMMETMKMGEKHPTNKNAKQVIIEYHFWLNVFLEFL